MFDRIKAFPYFVLFGAVWKYMGVHKRAFFLSLVLMMTAQLVGLASPYILGKLIDHIQHGVATNRKLVKGILLALAYFLITPVTWMFHGPSRIIERRTAFFVHKNYLEILYGKILALPYSWHQDFHSGQLVDRVKRSAFALQDFTSSQFTYMRFFTDFFGPLIILLWYFPWAGVACVAMGTIAFLIVTFFDKKLVPLYNRMNHLTHEEAGAFTDYMANIRTLITLRLGKVTQNEIINRYMARLKPLWSEIKLNEMKWGSIGVAADFFVAGLIMMILVWVHNGTALQIGSIVMLIQYLIRFSGIFGNIGGMYQQLVQQAMSYKSALPIEEEYAKVQLRISAEPQHNAQQHWDRIAVRHLHFSYKDKANRPHALKDLSFEFKRGEKVALVGSSGSGKSTLMALLRGLYDVESVALDVDGVIHPSLAVLKEITTLIPQDPEVFENTILYNITFGVEHSHEAIMHACEIACFDTVLNNLPAGLDTDVREKGVNMSGGQRQRLALARGVFGIAESSLILMDEPTSSVDTPTETRIFNGIFREFPDKTIVASIHRLHLLPLFDRVLVLDKGEIVQQGTFHSLIKTEGLLNELWTNYQIATKQQDE